MPEPMGHSDFLRLFHEHYPTMFGFVVRQGVPPTDADDVVQEAAAILWQKFDSFEPGSNFRAWALATARLEVLKRADRARRESRVLHLSPDALADIERLEHSSGGGDQRRDRLRACLDRLGDHVRRLLTWRYDEGLSYEQMAERTDSSPGALRTRLCRTRKWLEDCVRAQEGSSHG
ncbi:MAG: sigma-70 family RNA polymerase sigma factor [Planctomycetota bacterium]